MSSESSIYEVRENLRRVEQARIQAWSEARSLEGRAHSLATRADEVRTRYRQEFEQLGRVLPRQPADSCGLAEIETYVAALQAHCTAVEEDLNRTIASAETRRLLAALAEHIGGNIMPTKELFSPPRSRSYGTTHAPPLDSESERKHRENEAMRIVGRLSGGATADEREGAQRLAEEILQTSSASRAEMLVSELRRRVQRANERAQAASRGAQQALGLRARLRGLDGDDVDLVSAELAKVERREQALTDVLIRQAEEIEKVARARIDRKYAAEVIREEFERLGYDVEENFATLWVEGGQAYLQKPELREYRVVMRVDPETTRVDVRLARLGRASNLVSQHQKLRDHETEDALCHDLARLRELLKRRQIATRLLRRAPAGSEPIRIIEHQDLEDRREETAAMRRK